MSEPAEVQQALARLYHTERMVALGWVAAGFLFELGVTFDWVEVHQLAKLGGS